MEAPIKTLLNEYNMWANKEEMFFVFKQKQKSVRIK